MGLPSESTLSPMASVLAGGGELGALMRAFDWSSTPLGPPDRWSQSLRTCLRIMFTSRQPMWLGWGEQLTYFYNDPYKSIIGGKHPWALGRPTAEVWQEIWGEIGPRIERTMREGEGTYDEALLLIMERHGYPEETYYTFSYSPVPDERGGIGGLFCANSEDTARIIGQRQLDLLRRLAAGPADARTIADACARSVQALETNAHDLPFAHIYLIDDSSAGQQAVLAGADGIAPGHPAAPTTIALDGRGDDGLSWPIAEVLRTAAPMLVDDIGDRFGPLPTGAWDRPPSRAVVLPIAPSGETGRAGVLVAGLSPYRLYDDGYRGFLGLVAGQIAAAIANAQAYEEARLRAEALAELDRAKTAFFSNVSHELRTPLTLLLGPIEDGLIDAEQPLPPAQRERQELAHRNALRLLRMVNTLLDFARIEAGRTEASFEPTDLPALTADLAATFRSTIERAGLRLVVACPPLRPGVTAYIDRDMWEKIVLNLLSNAVKFTFEGTIGVSLAVAGDRAELVVRDTGTGIPADELPRLFERFHRVRGARSRTYEGTGIGLALVRELVQLHGGAISVASEPGAGTTFTVSVPLGSAGAAPSSARPAGRQAEPLAPASSPVPIVPAAATFVEEALRWLPETTPEDGVLDGPAGAGGPVRVSAAAGDAARRPRILLADDNADMRMYAGRLLGAEYEVVAVGDGAAALEAVRREPFDLVLSDVMMPRLDGFELLAALRSDRRYRLLPVILLSARAGEEARVEGIGAGADDYLAKPFSARELLARVRGQIRVAHLRREAARVEQALRAEAQDARSWLERVLAGIGDQFFVLDRDWRYILLSDRVAEVTGRPRQALLGRRIWELFPELLGTDFERHVRRAAERQEPARFEYVFSSAQRWFESRVYPSADGLIFFITDISDRRRADDALRLSEGRLRLLDTISEATRSAADPVRIMEATTHLLGEHLGADLCAYADVEPDADAFTVRHAWTAGRLPSIAGQYRLGAFGALAADRLRAGEPLVTRDVAADLGAAQAAPFRALGIQATICFPLVKDGRLTAMMAVHSSAPRAWAPDEIALVQEVTERSWAHIERARAALALRTSEEQLKAALEGGRLAAWRWDASANRIAADRRLAELFGVTPNDADEDAEAFFARIHPEDRPRVRQALGEALRPDGQCAVEFRVLLPDGGARWLAGAGRGRVDHDGQVRHIFGVALDVSERKALEHLQRDFIANVSHELRNPLSSIKGFAQLMRRRGTYGERSVEAIIAQTGQLERLIEDLLEASRLDVGRLNLRREPVDLAAVVRDAAESAPATTDRHRVKVEVPDGPVVGRWDRDRLGQILQNLLSNAIKYSPDGGEILIRVEMDGAAARVSVRDEGVGLAPEVLARLFERFYRAGVASGTIQGLGLGLYITRELVQAHGGHIWAESAGAGRGSTFHVVLPLAEEPAPHGAGDAP